MSSIEHAWNLVSRSVARYLRSAALKDELFLSIQVILKSLLQADVQKLLDIMIRRIAACDATRSGYTKY